MECAHSRYHPHFNVGIQCPYFCRRFPCVVQSVRSINGAAVAAIVGFKINISYAEMIEGISKNIGSITEPILILLMVGALAGTWMVSGIIPTMIYYGMQVLNPTIFLAASVVICSIVS